MRSSCDVCFSCIPMIIIDFYLLKDGKYFLHDIQSQNLTSEVVSYKVPDVVELVHSSYVQHSRPSNLSMKVLRLL